jgi:hypothetical protein
MMLMAVRERTRKESRRGSMNCVRQTATTRDSHLPAPSPARRRAAQDLLIVLCVFVVGSLSVPIMNPILKRGSGFGGALAAAARKFAVATGTRSSGWLAPGVIAYAFFNGGVHLISHEYFHAMNVKRLRPVELGPFDYEHTPVTTGLWIAEGLTSYFGDLLAARSGLGSAQEYLGLTSKHITDLQNSPGRLVQTLQQASAQMFERLPAARRVDYYVKGPVVGLVLDAHIRKLTDGRRSMDDVIRLEYSRWSGAHGYMAEQFARTASDAVGFDIGPLLQKLVATTEEIDYRETLDWFGLRVVPNDDPAKQWMLEVRPDVTPIQAAHFAALLAHSTAP